MAENVGYLSSRGAINASRLLRKWRLIRCGTRRLLTLLAGVQANSRYGPRVPDNQCLGMKKPTCWAVITWGIMRTSCRGAVHSGSLFFALFTLALTTLHNNALVHGDTSSTIHCGRRLSKNLSAPNMKSARMALAVIGRKRASGDERVGVSGVVLSTL